MIKVNLIFSTNPDSQIDEICIDIWKNICALRVCCNILLDYCKFRTSCPVCTKDLLQNGFVKIVAKRVQYYLFSNIIYIVEQTFTFLHLLWLIHTFGSEFSRIQWFAKIIGWKLTTLTSACSVRSRYILAQF